jgi:hypothetical protein
MRVATFFTYLFFFFFSLFVLAAALPAESDAVAVARADQSVGTKLMDAKATAKLPKTKDNTSSINGTDFKKDDKNRAICPRGLGYCPNTGVCCPLGGWCCPNIRCCARG